MLARSSKLFFAASASAVAAWVIGTICIGKAAIRHVTSSGVVDMTNPNEMLRAVQDPTFTTTVSWGAFTLTGNAWVFMLPILFAAAAVFAVYVLGVVFKGDANDL